jgi:nucleotide-binding universal stress UspA family protein
MLSTAVEPKENEMNRMVNFERILCPVTQSHENDEGLHYAIALARSYDARLFVLTCTDESSPLGADAVATIRADINRAVEHSFVLFPGAADTAHLDWELIVAEGVRPPEAITREAEARNTDLIVMGSRRRPYAAKLLGSTAETVYRTAPCPVLVTRLKGGRHPVSAIRGIDFKKLLVASDFSSDSELALQYGFSLAQEYQSELHLLHVMESKTKEADLAWTSHTEEGPYHEAARRLHQSVPAETHLWSEVTHAVREGRAHREIVSYAVEQEIDLICIGAHGQGFRLGTLFGSNADRVLRESPCPVLVARPLKAGAAFPAG